MKSFSQRYGFKPIKNIIQIDSMDDDLRVGLWNTILEIYFMQGNKYNEWHNPNYDEYSLMYKEIWGNHFKKPIDEFFYDWENNGTYNFAYMKQIFFSYKWYEVYDFLEFLANWNYSSFMEQYADEKKEEAFKCSCNLILEREMSGYRFIGNLITPITSETEIAEIEEALKNSEPYKTVYTHLHRALELLSDRKLPDYRNSIKESISSIEAFLKQITQEKDFAPAINKIENKIGIHPALKIAFTKLYGYTSDADGIRHGLMEESNIDFEDAKFILVSCSAFVNYLIVKFEKTKKCKYIK